MNKYFLQNLTDSLISEETFEITIENESCCDWCTVPKSRFICSLPIGQRLTGNDSTCIKRGYFSWGVRPCLLKIDTSVDEDIECHSTKLEKDHQRTKK